MRRLWATFLAATSLTLSIAAPAAAQSAGGSAPPRPTQRPAQAAPATPATPARVLPAPGVNIQGLAFGGGSLWAAELVGENHSTIYELDPRTGQVRQHFSYPDVASGLTHDGRYLYATADSGTQLCGGPNPNRIRAIDPRTGQIVRTIPSPITGGGGGGLGYVAGRLHAVGALMLDPCNHETQKGVVIAAVDPSSGALQSYFPVSHLGISPRELDGAGGRLLYASTSWPQEWGAPLDFTVYTLSASGQVLDQRVLFQVDFYDPYQYDINGLAWGEGSAYFANRRDRTILVYSFAPRG